MARHVPWSQWFFYAFSPRLAPGLQAARRRYNRAVCEAIGPATRWLDIGCGSRPLRGPTPEQQAHLLKEPALAVGIDLNFEHMLQNEVMHYVLLAEGAALPFPDGAFDLVTANMVAEHLPDPQAVLAEVSRVLAPGGRMIFHTPNRHSLMVTIARCLPDGVKRRLVAWIEGRPAERVFKTHYRLNCRSDIERLSAEAGLDIQRLAAIEDVPETLCLGPLVLAELLWIRLTRREALEPLRDNLIVTLAKPCRSVAASRLAA